MARLLVTYIAKRRPHFSAHERISHIGGRMADNGPWKMSEEGAIAAIDENIHSFYVRIGRKEVDIVIDKHLGKRYLKTKRDDYIPDNLLCLPDLK